MSDVLQTALLSAVSALKMGAVVGSSEGTPPPASQYI